MISNRVAMHLIPQLYPESPITIAEIEFTVRQFDIMSVFYALKKPQLVGAVLGITNKGVEAHIYNIKQKLPSGRKDLIYFLDTCPLLIRASLEKHYRNLLIENLFQETLESAFKLSKQHFYYRWDKIDVFPEGFPLPHVLNHLRIAGLDIAPSNETNAIVLRSDLILFSEADAYYTSLIALLQSILPEESHQLLFQSFLKKQDEIRQSLFYAHTPLPSQKNLIQKKMCLLQESIRRIYPSFNYRDTLFVAALLSVVSLVLLSKLLYLRPLSSPLISGGGSDPSVQRIHDSAKRKHLGGGRSPKNSKSATCTNIVISQKAFLERPKIIAKMSNRLSAKNGVQTIALVGGIGTAGGEGKTTLARYYGNQQKEVNIAWEFNAESRDKLLGSMEELAKKWAQQNKKFRQYRDIQQIQDLEKKQKALLDFIHNILSKSSNWLLIYDGVGNNINDVRDLLLQDLVQVEKGQIILTTTNQSIGKTGLLESKDVVSVEELSPEEAEQLFCMTLYEQKPHALSSNHRQEISNFVRELPPFPLDISVAALYIKATEVSFSDYLKKFKIYDRNLESSVQNVLGNHIKSRRSILVLSFDKLIEANSRYKEFLFLLSILGCRNIPKSIIKSCFHEVELEEELFELSKYGIISLDKNDTYSLHKSTLETLKYYISKNLTKMEKERFLKKTIFCLRKFFVNKKEEIFYSSFGNMYNKAAKYEVNCLRQSVNNIENIGLISDNLKADAKQLLLTMIGEYYFFFYYNLNLAREYFALSKIHKDLKNQFLNRVNLASIYSTIARMHSMAKMPSVAMRALKTESYLCKKIRKENEHCSREAILDNRLIMAYNLTYLGSVEEADEHFTKVITTLQGQSLLTVRQKLLLARALCYRAQLYSSDLLHKKSHHNFLDWAHLAHKVLGDRSDKDLNLSVFKEWEIRVLKNIGSVYIDAALYDAPFMQFFQDKMESKILGSDQGPYYHTRFAIYQIICEILLRKGKLDAAHTYLVKAKKVVRKIDLDFDANQLCLHLEILIRRQRYKEAYEEALQSDRIKSIEDSSNFNKLLTCRVLYSAALAAAKVNKISDAMEYFESFFRNVELFCKGFLDYKDYVLLQRKRVFQFDRATQENRSALMIEKYLHNSHEIFRMIYGHQHTFVRDFVAQNDPQMNTNFHIENIGLIKAIIKKAKIYCSHLINFG